MNINDFQKKIVTEVAKDIERLSLKNINIGKSSLTYFALWGESIGFEKLKAKIFGSSKFFSLFKIYLKDIISLVRSYDVEFFNLPKQINQKKIIVSSASVNDFPGDGSYLDRYFKINSKNYTEIIFILYYLGEKIPQNLDKNIIIFKKKKNNILEGLLFLIKYNLYFSLLTNCLY